MLCAKHLKAAQVRPCDAQSLPWNAFQQFRAATADLVDAHLPDPIGLRTTARKLREDRSTLQLSVFLSTRMRCLEPRLPAGVPEAAMGGLRKWGNKCAGPTFITARTLSDGWVTDARFGREVRACPWCREAGGHRLYHLLSC